MKRTFFVIMIIALVALSACSPQIVLDDNESDEPIACTAIYDPVCGVDGVTYSNGCSAGDVEIAYAGECQENTNQDAQLETPESNQSSESTVIDVVESCEAVGGSWLEQYNECEPINQVDCEYISGTHEECASSCRHRTDADCIEECVSICIL